MTPEEQQSADMAAILEGRIKERVDESVKKTLEPMVQRIVADIIARRFSTEKERMMLEIATTVGKILRVADEEERKPLWEYSPEELGLERLDQVFGNLKYNPTQEEIEDALRKQTTPIQT